MKQLLDSLSLTGGGDLLGMSGRGTYNSHSWMRMSEPPVIWNGKTAHSVRAMCQPSYNDQCVCWCVAMTLFLSSPFRELRITTGASFNQALSTASVRTGIATLLCTGAPEWQQLIEPSPALCICTDLATIQPWVFTLSVQYELTWLRDLGLFQLLSVP